MDYANHMQTLILFIVLAAIVVTYMSLWYAIALTTDRFDVVDSAWGLGFVVIAWSSLALHGNFKTLQLISAICVSLWGLRLFAHIANRNWRKHEDDHRYQAMRTKWGSSYKRKMFTNVFLLQGALLIGVSLPMIAIALCDSTANVVTYIGWVVWIFGIGYEAVADRQLATFISRRPKASHAIMDRGLWRNSRHPNYFGEVTTWWGGAIVAVSIGQWWGIAGALLITILITKISGIPPLEKHYDGNTAYEAYRKKTSVLVPLPQKNSNI